MSFRELKIISCNQIMEIVDAVAIPLWIIDNDGNLIYGNAAFYGLLFKLVDRKTVLIDCKHIDYDLFDDEVVVYDVLEPALIRIIDDMKRKVNESSRFIPIQLTNDLQCELNISKFISEGEVIAYSIYMAPITRRGGL